MPDIKIREMKKGTIKTLDKAAVASERIKNVSANTKDMADDKGCKSEMIIVPMFSCHIVRHTFATRMIEAGVNVKVIQDLRGHTDVRTTLNIYVDATRELKEKEIENMDKYLEDAM